VWRHFDEPATRKEVCVHMQDMPSSSKSILFSYLLWNPAILLGDTITMYVFKYSVSSTATTTVFAEDKGWTRCWRVTATLSAVVMITAVVHLQEVVLPLYSLWILIVIKYLVPNPNFPVMSTPRGEADLFEHFQQFKNHTIAIVPNTTETQVSTSHIIYQRDLWLMCQSCIWVIEGRAGEDGIWPVESLSDLIGWQVICNMAYYHFVLFINSIHELLQLLINEIHREILILSEKKSRDFVWLWNFAVLSACMCLLCSILVWKS